MRTNFFSHRALTGLLCLSLLFGLCGPIDIFTPSAQAATSAQKRKTRKLKKDNRKLKKQNQMLRMDLAAALTASGAPVAASMPPFIEMVTVGNAGNTIDLEDGSTGEGGIQNFGAVAGTFQIGKYEVTNAQYVEFLNSVAAQDPNGLFDANMESDARGGIRQFGTTPNFGYAAKAGMGDKPVNFVDFWDCCRFCNWLHNGMPTGAQDGSTTEDGAYTLPSTNPTNGSVNRNPGAKFHLPTEDQWYKAAYHEPGGDADGYWLYPTRSNDPPTVGTVNAIGEITNDDGNIANYNKGADWDSDDSGVNEDGNVTSVGSGGPGSASFYGACDMAGNVWEWNEAIILTSLRGFRGGPWSNNEVDLRSSSRGSLPPTTDFNNIGFRVASP